jgi:hypothetical protein
MRLGDYGLSFVVMQDEPEAICSKMDAGSPALRLFLKSRLHHDESFAMILAKCGKHLADFSIVNSLLHINIIDRGAAVFIIKGRVSMDPGKLNLKESILSSSLDTLIAYFDGMPPPNTAQGRVISLLSNFLQEFK